MHFSTKNAHLLNFMPFFDTRSPWGARASPNGLPEGGSNINMIMWHFTLNRPLLKKNSKNNLSFTNGVSEANVVKWKVSKTGIKKLRPPVYGWGFVCLSVCVSVCLSVCLSGLKSWITFDGMKGYWWNFQDQSNFSQVIFGRENQISRPKGYGPGPKTACF